MSNSAAKPIAPKICYEKYHQNTLGKNKDGLYAILKRRASSPFSSTLKNGGFCSRIIFQDLTLCAFGRLPARFRRGYRQGDAAG